MADRNKAGGVGAAGDAGVDTAGEEPIEQEDPRIAARAALQAAEAKVDKQKAHLAGAEDAVSDAEAALAQAEDDFAASEKAGEG